MADNKNKKRQLIKSAIILGGSLCVTHTVGIVIKKITGVSADKPLSKLDKFAITVATALIGGVTADLAECYISKQFDDSMSIIDSVKQILEAGKDQEEIKTEEVKED